MSKYIKYWVLLVLVGVIGLLTLYFAVAPRVFLKLIADDDGSLWLDVRKNFKVNRLTGIELVVDEQPKPLWELAFNETPPKGASFHLHEGAPEDAGQIPRLLRSGETFTVRVYYQYDSQIPPAALGGGTDFHFRVSRDGRPELLGTTTR
jgi:hypothetical protein